MRKPSESANTFTEQPLEAERAALATDYLAVKLELNVIDAESAVLASEAVGVTDVFAMRRLDRARRELHKLLAERQWARALSNGPGPLREVEIDDPSSAA
ncbi:hypothetical protein GIY23_20630 [Allosaccharopolyspora coralli]|uniref:Uncharacterized protein n=1 Tax=Allosaccharopolyspora coralli TaxID=2665642 RepID=A0A5Q3QEF4_9PSEU|nr:hypothetical protein [Allosaccharopolyspora coralli]QGK71604.1 hypothetical protein GIY23_20630 [Allosaccharopolyspora coralli]